MSDVFISYSRKNSDFVHKLDNALAAEKRDVWIDWQDIARGEDWWRSIQMGVDSTDTALIVITENWLVSEVCHRELEYIRQQNKRVFPIIREKVEGDLAIRVKGTWVDQEWEQRARDNWKYLRSVNWLYFDDDTTFDTVFKDLLTALDTDQAYVKSHTRYLVRALEWQQSKRDPSFLLEGDQLEAAQTWLKGSINKTPEPLPTHHEYVTSSQIAETVRIARDKAREQLIRRFRQAAVLLGVAVVLAIIATAFVGQQFISARAEVTHAGATLQQVNILVTAAINQQVTAAAQVQAAEALVSTATIEQGNAVLAQQTSAAREHDASTQVAVAGSTLSPVPPTLTAVAAAIADAKMQQEIALDVADSSLQIAGQNYDGALQIQDQAIATYPNQPLAYLGRALILQNTGQTDKAIADYTTAIKLNPKYETAYFNRGNAYASQSDWDKAIADFTAAIQLDPTDTDAYLNRGNSYSSQAKYELAIADYDHLIQANPDASLVYLNRGQVYEAWQKPDQAIADYNQAIKIDPNYTDAYFNRGNTYKDQMQLAQAIADYNQVIAIDPNYFSAYFNRATIYEYQGTFDKTAADYWKWVESHQTNSTQARTIALGQTPFTTTVTMTAGLSVRIPFDAHAGQLVQASATVASGASVSPLLLILDPQDHPIMAAYNHTNDKDNNPVITDYALPSDGTYTLVVSYGANGSEGDINVALDLTSAASTTPTLTPTPQ